MVTGHPHERHASVETESRARSTGTSHRRRDGWPLAGRLVLYWCGVLPWLLMLPPFEGPDEPAHYDYARYIAATGSLPSGLPTAIIEDGWHTTHRTQPPLYYLLVSGIIRGFDVAAVSPNQVLVADPASTHLGGASGRVSIYQGTAPRIVHAPHGSRMVPVRSPRDARPPAAGFGLPRHRASGAPRTADRRSLSRVWREGSSSRWQWALPSRRWCSCGAWAWPAWRRGW